MENHFQLPPKKLFLTIFGWFFVSSPIRFIQLWVIYRHVWLSILVLFHIRALNNVFYLLNNVFLLLGRGVYELKKRLEGPRGSIWHPKIHSKLLSKNGFLTIFGWYFGLMFYYNYVYGALLPVFRALLNLVGPKMIWKQVPKGLTCLYGT